MDIMAKNGPIDANVYCANPPVKFGNTAFNSLSDNAVKILIPAAISIGTISATPNTLDPIPSDIKQPVAKIRPTPVATTLGNPNFFLFTAFPS